MHFAPGRRLTSAFGVKYFTDLTTCPWECNYAVSGHTVMHAKRVLAPVPVPSTPSMIDATLVPPPMLTASVPYTPDEAGFDPPLPVRRNRHQHQPHPVL